MAEDPVDLRRVYDDSENPHAVSTARTDEGMTPLMDAAMNNHNPEVITTLLKAGADAKAKDSAGKTAFDYAQNNEKLKGTDAYRKLQEASNGARRGRLRGGGKSHGRPRAIGCRPAT